MIKGRLFFVSALLSMLIIMGSCMTKRKDKLIMATDYSYFPYEYTNVVGEAEGFDLEIAKELAKVLNKKLVIVTMPFYDQPKALEEGTIDMILNGLTITPERSKRFILIPYHNNPVHSYFLAFNHSIPEDIKSIDDFRNKSRRIIGTQKGTLKEDYLASMANISFISEKTTEKLMNDLN